MAFSAAASIRGVAPTTAMDRGFSILWIDVNLLRKVVWDRCRRMDFDALKPSSNHPGEGLYSRYINERRNAVALGGVEHYNPRPLLEDHHAPDASRV